MNPYYFPSGYNNHFSTAFNTDFADYIKTSQQMITRARAHLVDNNTIPRAQIVEVNSPQQHLPQNLNAHKKHTFGVVLIHGLLDSPYTLKSIFDYFAAKDYALRSVLLPGHGTLPGDLLHPNAEDYLQATRYAIQSLAPYVENLYIVGYSFGAALSVVASYEFPNIKGLILIAPCFKPSNPLADFSHWFDKLGRFGPRGKWYLYRPEDDYAKYQSLPFIAAKQVAVIGNQAVSLAQKSLLPYPLLMSISADEEVVNLPSALNYFYGHSDPRSRLIYYTTNSQAKLPDERVVYRNSCYPEYHIINFSHRSIPIALDHPHYGYSGDYRDQSHYYNPIGKYFKKQAQRHRKSQALGAITLSNLRSYQLSRLTFNPDFFYLMKEIDEFIGRTQS